MLRFMEAWWSASSSELSCSFLAVVVLNSLLETEMHSLHTQLSFAMLQLTAINTYESETAREPLAAAESTPLKEILRLPFIAKHARMRSPVSGE